MCVIIYKPEGAKLPSANLLYKAYVRNPHGCGFVSPSVNYKGLSFALFESKLKRCDKEDPILIHFRFATHGSVRRANCHPFYDCGTDTYFMHNGILNDIITEGDRTDSETAFKDILLPCIKQYGLESTRFTEVVNRIIGYSKFAFMQKGKVVLFGDFIHQDGLYFSNLRFV